MNAVDLKDQGNRLFAARQYEDAIGCYSKAILKNPSAAIFYTNRALCFIKLQKWNKAIADCQRAIEIEPKSVKGNFFLGQAHLELDNYDESITSFKRAFDLAKEQKLNFGDDVANALRSAKKRRWNAMEEKRIAQEIELQTYVNNLITEEVERKIAHLKAGSGLNVDQLDGEIEKLTLGAEKKKKQLNDLLAQVDDRRRRRDVPDYMCGKISFEILRDPVITPSGITYDRKDIEEHLQRVGHFDPVTRADLKSEQLIPNLVMKEVVDSFLEENGWAEDY